jgi:predicted HTH domain antitoxin
MSTKVSLEIPREVIHATKMSAEELRRELAIHLFQQGKLSFGKAKEMAGMTFWEFQQLLGARGILVHYGLEDYEEDLDALRDLRRI